MKQNECKEKSPMTNRIVTSLLTYPAKFNLSIRILLEIVRVLPL